MEMGTVRVLTWCDGIAATWLMRLHDIKANTKEIHTKGDEDKLDDDDDEEDDERVTAASLCVPLLDEEYQVWSDDDNVEVAE